VSLSRIRRLAAVLALGVVLPGRALAVCNQPCNSAAVITNCCAGTSCLLDGSISVVTSSCTLNLGARVVNLSGMITVGSNMLTVEAAAFRIVGSGLVNARGPSPGGHGGKVVMNLTGGASPAFSSTGVPSSGIDASGFASGGGVIEIHADGPVNLSAGGLLANALDTNGNGGSIQIDTVCATPSCTMMVGIPVSPRRPLRQRRDRRPRDHGRPRAHRPRARELHRGRGFGGEIDLTARAASRSRTARSYRPTP
jgi:hypothetical protein